MPLHSLLEPPVRRRRVQQRLNKGKTVAPAPGWSRTGLSTFRLVSDDFARHESSVAETYG
jgi:hypothetical protein